MKPKHFQTGLLVASAFALAHCSSPEVSNNNRPIASESGTPAIAHASDSALTDSEKDQALQFVNFTKGKLNQDEEKELIESCSEEAGENPFCFSIINFERLKIAKRPNKFTRTKTKKKIRFRFAGGEIVNWEDLRHSPVSSLLRGLGSLGPKETQSTIEKAKDERRCPNNVSLALAVHLEDDLPERISPLELANLYAGGAHCSTEQPVDRETMLCRAGLFYFLANNLKEAETFFDQASKTENAYTGRSLYWLYRTRLANENKKGSEEALSQLKAKYPFSFHTLVALTSNSQDPGNILQKSLILGSKRSKDLPDVNHLITQVEILRRAKENETANRVLNWAMAEADRLEPDVKLYLAELKDDQKDQRSKISLLTEVLYNHPSFVSKETMELYFPKLYFPIFEKHSGGLDPLFLVSVARQESAFNAKAVSTAKAKGLLQVQPKTGRRFWSPKKMDLTDPETNVQIGARYLQDLLRRTNGQVHFALAAYNAGELRLSHWEDRYQTTEPILFIDLIPFRETREYVASILRNYFWYRRLHTPQDPVQRVLGLSVTRSDKETDSKN